MNTNLQSAQKATAALAACIVQTLNETDPSFQARFVRTLEKAYQEFRDATEGDYTCELDLLSYTRQLLTGFSVTTGQS
jgi:hypothetical protein